MTIFSIVDEPRSLSDVDDSLGVMPVPGEEEEEEDFFTLWCWQ